MTSLCSQQAVSYQLCHAPTSLQTPAPSLSSRGRASLSYTGRQPLPLPCPVAGARSDFPRNESLLMRSPKSRLRPRGNIPPNSTQVVGNSEGYASGKFRPGVCQGSASSVAGTEMGSSGALQKDTKELPAGAAALTYLEGNSWVVDAGGVNILVDPILEGPLDFGIPWLYSAFKPNLRNLQVADVAKEADCLLITQSLDDHCHINTLRPLSALRRDLPVIATPNAEPILSTLFTNVTYLEPGESTEAVCSSTGASATVTATAGPVLGPPWQRPENGYIIRSNVPGGVSVYLEPHCSFDEEELKKQDKVDVVVTPVVKQVLPAFTLVYGQEDAVRLACALRPRYIVPMANGELDASGILSVLVQEVGTLDAFERLLKAQLPNAEVQPPTPGKPLYILPA